MCSSLLLRKWVDRKAAEGRHEMVVSGPTSRGAPCPDDPGKHCRMHFLVRKLCGLLSYNII